MFNKGVDEDSPHSRGHTSAEPGSERQRLEALAEAVAEFPSEPTGETRLAGDLQHQGQAE